MKNITHVKGSVSVRLVSSPDPGYSAVVSLRWPPTSNTPFLVVIAECAALITKHFVRWKPNDTLPCLPLLAQFVIGLAPVSSSRCGSEGQACVFSTPTPPTEKETLVVVVGGRQGEITSSLWKVVQKALITLAATGNKQFHRIAASIRIAPSYDQGWKRYE